MKNQHQKYPDPEEVWRYCEKCGHKKPYYTDIDKEKILSRCPICTFREWFYKVK